MKKQSINMQIIYLSSIYVHAYTYDPFFSSTVVVVVRIIYNKECILVAFVVNYHSFLTVYTLPKRDRMGLHYLHLYGLL